MKKIFSISAFVMVSMLSQIHANLIALDQQEMMQSVGQGAAELSWTLSLNHQYANDLNLQSISRFDNGVIKEAYYDYMCVDEISCRFALAANNHVDADGNKKWLVFKQFQGTLQIDKFMLEGVTIKNQYDKPQTALKLSFEDAHPLKIRNLGFASLAVETGNATQEGFSNLTKYTTFNVKDTNNNNVVVDVLGFDKGQEQGFMGLNIHGNMHMNGALKIFSFNCTGMAGSRC